MDENYNNFYHEEMEINLLDLMFYLLKRWKSLVVCLVLGVLFGMGIYLVKSSSDKDLLVDQMLKDEEEDIVAEKLKISPDTIINMELAYQYRELYQGQIEYNQNSILMKLDPNQTYRGVLKYYIAAEDNTDLISCFYQNIINDQTFIHNIKESASLSCEEQYVKELITCTIDTNNNTFINISNTREDLFNDINDISQNSILTYIFTYSDGATCEKVLESICESLDGLKQECEEKYGEFFSEIVFDGVQFVADNSRLDKQKSDIDIMNACLTNSTKLESAFTENEMAYYESVYLGRTEENESSVVALETESEVEKSSIGVLNWLLIGLFLAIVCWGVYYLISYFLDKHIKYAEELSNYYKLHLIGRYQDADKTFKGIDRLWDQVVNKNVGAYSSKEYIASALNLLNVNSLYLIGDIRNEEIKKFLMSINSLCSKADYGDLMQNSSSSIEKAKGKEGIVFLIKKGSSTYTEIQRELEISRVQKLQVCGAIMLE